MLLVLAVAALVARWLPARRRGWIRRWRSGRS